MASAAAVTRGSSSGNDEGIDSSFEQLSGSPRFTTPGVYVNVGGWGPTTLPEQYVGVPYNPFGKGDRIGKCADFMYAQYQAEKLYGGALVGYGDEGALDFDYEMVDNSQTRRPNFRGRRRWRGGNHRNAYLRRKEVEDAKVEPKGKAAKYLKQPETRRTKQWKRQFAGRRRNNRRYNDPADQKEASVKVQGDWVVVEQFDISALSKMSMKPPKAEDLMWAGELGEYNETYESCSTKRPQALKRQEKLFAYETTLDDENLVEFAQSKAGNVFATDELISHLMACTRSVKPWDIVFTRVAEGEDAMLFIDKREDSNMEILTVDETSTYRPKTEEEERKRKEEMKAYNTPERLSIEATAINENFTQQVLKPGKSIKYENPNPFMEEDEMDKAAQVAYRYRKWKLGESVTIVARTTLHGYRNVRGEKKNMVTFALNEYDPKVSGSKPYKQQLDQKRGAVLAQEIKNNAMKLSKWAAQSLLSGADLIKLGFVSRASVRDCKKHNIVGTQFYKPSDLSRQINQSRNNMWGILKMFIDLCMKQPMGKYLLMRDPNKPLLRLYQVPNDAFASDDEDEDDEE